MADGILNEILRKVNQLSPVELDLLLKAGKEMQQTAARDTLCVDSENPPLQIPDGLTFDE